MTAGAKARRSGLPFSAEEDRKIRALRAEGVSLRKIASRLERSHWSIEQRWQVLLDRPEPTEPLPPRRCMKCRREFMPSHRGQYYCNRVGGMHRTCRAWLNDQMSGFDVVYG